MILGRDGAGVTQKKSEMPNETPKRSVCVLVIVGERAALADAEADLSPTYGISDASGAK